MTTEKIFTFFSQVLVSLHFCGAFFFSFVYLPKISFFSPAFLASTKYSATEGFGRQVGVDGIFLNCQVLSQIS